MEPATEPVITMIYPANIPQVWSEVKPLLEPALAIAETHNAEDVYQSLMGGKSQLWVQWSGKIDSAVVTEFIAYPRGLWFRVWLAGALKGAESLWQKFYEILYSFAEQARCAGIEDCGRGGWDHYVPQAKKVGVVRRIKIGGQDGGR